VHERDAAVDARIVEELAVLPFSLPSKALLGSIGDTVVVEGEADLACSEPAAIARPVDAAAMTSSATIALRRATDVRLTWVDLL